MLKGGLFATLSLGLAAVFLWTWAASAADMRFLHCDGVFHLDSGDAACRFPAYLSVAGATVASSALVAGLFTLKRALSRRVQSQEHAS